jgi:hypothetical protein
MWGGRLGTVGDERLPKKQAVADARESLPVKERLRVGRPPPERLEDPGDLDGAGRECASAGPSRPRTIALAGPRHSEPEGLLGHGHIERTLQPEGDGAAVGDVRGDDLDQVADLGAAAVSLDSVPSRVGTRPAEAVIRDGADVGAVDR